MTTQHTITIIPAQAGWFVFRLYGDGSFGYDPIVAWEVESSAWDNRRQTSTPLDSPSKDKVISHVFAPLTIMGQINYDTPWVIKRPDGIFEEPVDREQFADETAAMEFLKAERAKEQQRRDTA